MATQTKRLKDGTECIRVIVKDDENEVRVHVHQDAGNNHLDPSGDLIRGLVVDSAKLGLICEIGNVTGECD